MRAGGLSRWRLVNASTARYYRLRLAGHTFWQIGTDGGLLDRPVAQDELLLAPGERTEVLVRADGQPGATTWLESWPYDRGAHHPAPGPAIGAGGHHHWRVSAVEGAPMRLLKVAYAPDAPVAGPAVPTALRPVTPLPIADATQRVVRFSEDHMQLKFHLDGRAYDPARVDLRGTLGATELWEVRNEGDMDHPFHLQGARLQLLDRDGVAQPFLAWKDTFNVKPRQSVRMAVRFEGGPGRRTYQCQITEHADMGMMGQIQIGAPPAP
jgi:FtsP/CotA-like multicopper oxidase with cupredoxin domain